MHTATVETTTRRTYTDRTGTATEALTERINRLKATKTPHHVNNTTVTWTDPDGTTNSITYHDQA